ELMIGALCESPLTFEALTVWRDELVEGKALLRDIIDLEAMYGGVPGAEGPLGQGIAGVVPGLGAVPPGTPPGAPAPAAPGVPPPVAPVQNPAPQAFIRPNGGNGSAAPIAPTMERAAAPTIERPAARAADHVAQPGNGAD